MMLGGGYFVMPDEPEPVFTAGFDVSVGLGAVNHPFSQNSLIPNLSNHGASLLEMGALKRRAQ